MKFENPKPDDLEFEFLLDKAECLITVRKYRDFNDDTAKKLFPVSSAQYFPSTTYTVPAKYFSEPFWIEEKRRHQRIRDVWETNRNSLERDTSLSIVSEPKYIDCMAGIVTIIEMCKWMLNACWEGDRSKPPIPLHLYRIRMNELKQKNHSVTQRLHEFSVFYEEQRQTLKEISSDISEPGRSAPKKRRAEEKELEESLRTFKKKTPIRNKERETERNVSTPSPIAQPTSTNNTPTNAESRNNSAANSASKRGRRSAKKLEETGEKKVDISVAVDDPNDDLISRVKRGQRNRRPARSFTPGWTPPGSPTPSKPTPTKSKTISSAGRGTPPVNKTVPLSSCPQTVGPLSPDSGRPSSNESSDVSNPVKDTAAKPTALQQKETAPRAEVSPRTSIPNRIAEKPGPSQNAQPPFVTALPSTLNIPSRSTAVRQAISPQPPPLNLTEQDLVAIWKERIKLGDVRITLLNMFGSDGKPQYHFIPLMIETIDKAIAALEKNDLISFYMHKAAIEAGCNQLGSIMRSCNPVEPTSQLASLATTMGINPAPFMSMLQPSTSSTGLNPNMLVDLHEAATVVAAREQVNGGYLFAPQQPSDQFPGFIERDLSRGLL
uniref:Bromo domain-containing protein n=1 Tax=Haemonchus contortus TaxID=6289 RepID=A0A7I4Y2X0_HAECO